MKKRFEMKKTYNIKDLERCGNANKVLIQLLRLKVHIIVTYMVELSLEKVRRIVASKLRRELVKDDDGGLC